MGYRVLIVIKNEWWSDGRDLPTFNDARTHRAAIAQRWNDCETAIKAPDGRILAYQESLKFEAGLSELRKLDDADRKNRTGFVAP